MPGEIRVFMNHIYEFKKGVRNMVLYTMSKQHLNFVTQRLQRQKIAFFLQDVGNQSINLFFGKPECIEIIKHIIRKPLNKLSPEEDFILGTLLGYDVCNQCQRYEQLLKRKKEFAESL